MDHKTRAKPKAGVWRISLFIVALLALTCVFLFIYRDALHHHVVGPALEAYFHVRYYLTFIPQGLLWGLPFAVLGFIALRRLVRHSRSGSEDLSPSVQPYYTQSPASAELEKLDALIQRARHSRFARVRVARTLSEIAVRLIAQNEGIPVATARNRLSGGIWRSTTAVHEFLIPRRHYASRAKAAEFHEALHETIRYLESYDQFEAPSTQQEQKEMP